GAVGLILKSRDEEWVRKSHPPSPSHAALPTQHPTHKKCPFCAEVVRSEATLCRFCQKEMPAGGGAAVALASEPAHPHAPAPQPQPQIDSGKVLVGACALLGLLYLAYNYLGTSARNTFSNVRLNTAAVAPSGRPHDFSGPGGKAKVDQGAPFP